MLTHGSPGRHARPGWRAALLATIMAAIALLLVTQLGSDGGREVALEQVVTEGGEEPWEVAEAYSTVGDPPQDYGSAEEGRAQADARVEKMQKLYPHTWSQGAAQKGAYPYPQDGTPPAPNPPVSPKKSDDTEGPAPSVSEATQATEEAVSAAQEEAAIPSQVGAVEKALDTEGKVLSAPVPVTYSTPPTVPTPPKGLLTTVLPLPEDRRPISWQQAKALKKSTQSTILNNVTKVAQAAYLRSLFSKPSQQTEQALAKERRWKPAYKKAQADAAKHRAQQAKQDAERRKQALLKQQAQQRAAQEAEQKLEEHSERSEKHDAAVASIQGHLAAMQTDVSAFDNSEPDWDRVKRDDQTAVKAAEHAAISQKGKAEFARTEAEAAATAQAKEAQNAQNALVKNVQESLGLVRTTPTVSESTISDMDASTRRAVEAHEVRNALQIAKARVIHQTAKEEALAPAVSAAQQASLEEAENLKHVFDRATTYHKHERQKVLEYQKKIQQEAALAQQMLKDAIAAQNADAIDEATRIKKEAAAQAKASADALKKETEADLAVASNADQVATAALATYKEWTKKHTDEAGTDSDDGVDVEALADDDDDDDAGTDDAGTDSAGADDTAKLFDAAVNEVLDPAATPESIVGEESPVEVLLQQEPSVATIDEVSKGLEKIVAYANDAQNHANVLGKETAAERASAEQADVEAASVRAQASQGLANVDAAAQQLSAVDPQVKGLIGSDTPPNRKVAQSLAAAQNALLNRAYVNAKTAFDATTPTYERVSSTLQAQKLAAAQAKEEAQRQAALQAEESRQHQEQELASIQNRRIARVAQVQQQKLAREQQRREHARQVALRDAEFMQGVARSSAEEQQGAAVANEQVAVVQDEITRLSKATTRGENKFNRDSAVTHADLHEWIGRGDVLQYKIMKEIQEDLSNK